jgi:hypothetical protein
MPTLRSLPQNLHSHEYGAGARPFWFFLYPAYSILPLVRSPLGYDMVKPWRAICESTVVAVVPYVLWFLYGGIFQRNPPPDWGGQKYLVLLMAASAITACVTFARRIRDERAGLIIHEAEAGYSLVTQRTELSVPLCEIVIMPALIAGAGWLLYSPDLFDVSVWLMLCGASYARMAIWEYFRERAEIRVANNDKARARVLAERVNRTGSMPGASAQDAPHVATFGGGKR